MLVEAIVTAVVAVVGSRRPQQLLIAPHARASGHPRRHFWKSLLNPTVSSSLAAIRQVYQRQQLTDDIVVCYDMNLTVTMVAMGTMVMVK